MAEYNLIIKAETVEAAARHVDEHLSIPVKAATPLGYGEVIVSVEGDFDDKLHKWLAETRPHDNDPFTAGALIWFTA